LIKPVDRISPGHCPTDVIEAIEWPTAIDCAPFTASCPNCGDCASKRPILRTPWPNGKVKDGKATLITCANCGCGFFHPAESADYGAEPVDDGGSLAFYLQQGAGVWGITSNLADLNRPAGTRFLEVGCGFGFALDFARRALGWQVLGLDPSPFAAAGRAAFGLPIQSHYLEAEHAALGGRFDVVMASEVIEHVPSPPAFVRMLWTALRDGGTLVLTTPDVEAVGLDTPRGLLVPLLSIGYHLVLQSKRSLKALLCNAGFVEVEVRQVGGTSLMARGQREAATLSLAFSGPDAPDNRDLYRRYLRDAAASVARDGDLWFGLTARAYREVVNAADRLAADALWDGFTAACRRRFGAAPETMAVIPGDVAGEALDILAAREPLCLGPMLLHRAFHRMLTGEARSAVESLFRSATDACGRLRRSLQRIGSDDGDAEDAAWVACAEDLLCAAERGAAEVPERFAALGSAPGDLGARRDGRSLQTDSYRRRIFVSLVNAARLDDADRLADATAQVEARAALPGTLLTADELDVLFCAAVRELQRPEAAAMAAARALELLRRLRASCDTAIAAGRAGSAAALIAPARDAELLALNVLGQTVEADALRRAAEDKKAATWS